jgi:hypothetical protein
MNDQTPSPGMQSSDPQQPRKPDVIPTPAPGQDSPDKAGQRDNEQTSPGQASPDKANQPGASEPKTS